MIGIYQNPELTSQILTPDGWYRTGDLGRLEDDKFLYLEGRKSDSFKLSNGKYVSALRVESALAQSPLIRHALVQGPNQQHLTALLHVNLDAVDASTSVSPESLRVILATEVARLWNNAYPNEPPVKYFDWVLDDWTIDTGAFTPTYKLKRKVLIDRYKPKFNQLIHEK
jgi:long-chain acyl-CoA synthetase